MGLITVLALVYIHLQMQIIELAYRGKAKEKQIRKLIEANSNVTYTILTLKSVNNLGGKLLASKTNMQFADPKNVVQVSTSAVAIPKNQPINVTVQSKRANTLLSLLSLGAQAEARPNE